MVEERTPLKKIKDFIRTTIEENNEDDEIDELNENLISATIEQNNVKNYTYDDKLVNEYNKRYEP